MNSKETIFTIFENCKNERRVFDQESEEIVRHLAPQSQGFTTYSAKGDVDRTNILDATPERAADDLISSMAGFLASPDKVWFKLGVEGEDDPSFEVKQQLNTATTKILKHCAQARTNFYSAIGKMAEQLVHHGQSFVYCHPTIKGKKKFVRYCTFPIQECYTQRDAYDEILYFFRCYKLKKSVFLNEFNLDKSDLNPTEKKQIQSRSENDEIQILHAILDKNMAQRLGLKPTKEYVSVYYHYECKKILHQDNLKYFPIAAPYWNLLTNENYGRGPGHKALPEIRVLNEMIQDNLAAANVMVRPPMAAMLDYLAAPEQGVDLSPGALVYLTLSNASAATGLIKPEAINTITNLPISVEMEDRKKMQIKETFFVDLLTDDKRVEMSATESSMREQSRVMKLTKPLTNATTHGLAPLVNFTLRVLNDWGVVDLDFDLDDLEPVFMTALFDAVNLNKIQKLERALVTMANTQNMPPELLAMFEDRDLMEYVFEKFGVDLFLLRSKEEVQRKQQELQRTQQAQNLREVAGASKDLAQAFATGQEI